MYRVCAVILTLVVAVNGHASQNTTNPPVCICSGANLSCILDGPDAVVNVTDDYCDCRIDNLFLYLPRNTSLSSPIFVGTKAKPSRFSISGDHLKYVSERLFFAHERTLEEVTFGYGQLNEIPSAAIQQLQHFDKLIVTGNPITSIDCSFQHHLHLARLHLIHNEISILYKCAFPRNLKDLYLYNNRIKTLNGSVKGHKHLVYFFVHDNMISSLEGELEGLDKLYHLDAARNNIETIGTTPVRLDGLTILDLSHNHISELGSSLNGFVNLLSLNLDYNYFESLSLTSFSNLTKLRGLSVSNNRIRYVENALFGHLRELRFLKIINNRLKNLNGKLNGLNSLKALYASENRIKVIGNAFRSIYLLKKLDLSYNRIRYLGNNLSTLSQLEILDLAYNEIEYISESNFYGLKSLRTLNISRNDLDPSVNGTVFASITNLTLLNLSWTHLNLQDLMVPGFMGIRINSTSLLTDATSNFTQREFTSTSRKLTKSLWMEGNDVGCLEPLIAVLVENDVQLKGCQ